MVFYAVFACVSFWGLYKTSEEKYVAPKDENGGLKQLDKAYKKSRIYVTGLGLYELYLDGERVGNEYLTPGCTDYNRWIQYQTYEVQIKNGQHRLKVFLAGGWYKGRFGLDHAINNYGDRHKMILELVIPTSGHCDFYKAEILEGPTDRLTARYGQPVIIKEEIKPIEIIHNAGRRNRDRYATERLYYAQKSYGIENQTINDELVVDKMRK